MTERANARVGMDPRPGPMDTWLAILIPVGVIALIIGAFMWKPAKSSSPSINLFSLF